MWMDRTMQMNNWAKWLLARNVVFDLIVQHYNNFPMLLQVCGIISNNHIPTGPGNCLYPNLLVWSRHVAKCADHTVAVLQRKRCVFVSVHVFLFFVQSPIFFWFTRTICPIHCTFPHYIPMWIPELPQGLFERGWALVYKRMENAGRPMPSPHNDRGTSVCVEVSCGESVTW